ncbi:MerR family copper efflux transcriptional regulator [Arthrobacter sp. V1I9]|jgi:DNA-binding transcriptional MerR regulator|uniref:heavy metal-responsive transcriptional regulator n=1 Tax=Arthrobacter sp. V1I9 TaxID=3042275 RepID=UPI00278FEEA4|nr:heavy metal-responsive transcriptional regulator [Arthrobacter sp. V1I9]MDQ0871066.1 MerR family copper efflux transcriptional regulator [Arthrobacter sp. V1I9]
MRIGEAAAAAGTTTKALRFYEERGLLPDVGRTDSGYRDYSPAMVSRLEFIRRSKDAGLGLAQIKEILRIRDAGHAPCAQVSDQLTQQLDALDRQIAELTALRATVSELHRTLTAADPAACEPTQICSYL